MQLAAIIHAGIHQMVQNGFDEAGKWALNKLLIDYPDFAAAHNDLAVLSHDKGDYKTALKHYQLAAKYAPGNFAIQKNLGDFTYAIEKDAESALKQFTKALMINPRDIDTLTIAGHLCVTLKRFDEARSYYEKVLNIDPSNATVQNYLRSVISQMTTPTKSPDEQYQQAQDLIEQGKQSEAKLVLEKLVNHSPDYAAAYNDLGVIAFEGGDNGLALEFYKKATMLQPENGVFQKNLGEFYFLIKGSAEKSLKAYIQVLKSNPEDIEALMGCGRICMAVSKPEDARDFFERILDLEPWHNEARQLLEEIEIQSSNRARPIQTKAAFTLPANELESLERLVAQQPDNASAQNDLAVLYYEDGSIEKALRAYEKAVALEPHNSVFKKNLADFYFVEQKRAGDALKIYTRLLEQNPLDEHCLFAAGMICISLERTDDAQVFFNRLLEINPMHEMAQQALAAAHGPAVSAHRAQIIDFNKQMAS